MKKRKEGFDFREILSGIVSAAGNARELFRKDTDKGNHKGTSKRKKQVQRNMIVIVAIITLVLIGSIFGIRAVIQNKQVKKEQQRIASVKKEEEVKKKAKEQTDLIEKANRTAAGYDYDTAAAILKEYTGYEENTSMTEAIARYEDEKSKLVEADVNQVTHIFYHSLLLDPSLAFDGDYKQDDYNQIMTTVEEFNKITQQMYDKGYVLVSIYDLVEKTTDANGKVTFAPGKIMLPEGKIPYVLSIDDVCYYHYMDGDGFPTKLIVDENGKPKNEYKDKDGSISVGNYDVMPLMDAFIEEHPDASYKGAKGIVGVTGYDGVLGYRTDTAYKTKEKLDDDQKKFIDENPDFNFDQEVEDAKKAVQSLKDNGWIFASHTWGHKNYGDMSFEKMKIDADKWEERVEPIVGDTDILIFPFGADIGGSKEYSGEKYDYLKSLGFDYYCNVDSNPYWVQITDRYVRQGRRNLDGVRMYYDMAGGKKSKLSDLFDVKSVFDPARPTPVLELK